MANQSEVHGLIASLAAAANEQCDVKGVSYKSYGSSEDALKKRQRFASKFSGFRLVRLERLRGEVERTIYFTSKDIPEKFPRVVDLTRRRPVDMYDVDEEIYVVSEVSS